MDFREAYEGFAWSHASIMHNVTTRIGAVKRIVQVGIRDFGSREREFADSLGKRCKVYDDRKLSRTSARGAQVAKAVAEKLPPSVYLLFDIDGLDPSLCPHTGTPVPGGLDFRFICDFLETLSDTGVRIVGFDLVEVAPEPDGAGDWDANVGARLLYKLCGLASRSNAAAPS